MTSELTTTTVVGRLELFYARRKYFCFQNASGYSWHCNFYTAGIVGNSRS
jgi:hypothetical protein